MEAFSEIFEAMVHDHAQSPRNFGDLENYTHEAEGVNPLTGDRLNIQFQVENEHIVKTGFTGKASSLATTSASVMTGVLAGTTIDDALSKISDTLARLNDEATVPDDLPDDSYSVLLEIRNFPHRVRCAALAWNTAKKALECTLYTQ